MSEMWDAQTAKKIKDCWTNSDSPAITPFCQYHVRPFFICEIERLKNELNNISRTHDPRIDKLNKELSDCEAMLEAEKAKSKWLNETLGIRSNLLKKIGPKLARAAGLADSIQTTAEWKEARKEGLKEVGKEISDICGEVLSEIREVLK